MRNDFKRKAEPVTGIGGAKIGIDDRCKIVTANNQEHIGQRGVVSQIFRAEEASVTSVKVTLDNGGEATVFPGDIKLVVKALRPIVEKTRAALKEGIIALVIE